MAPRKQISEDSAEIILDEARKRFTEAGIRDVQGKYAMGGPANKILGYVEQNGVDLIVLGYRGLGPYEGLLGGVARKIVNVTTISVLIAA